MLNDVNFVGLAKRRNIVPTLNSRNDADALEALDLLAATEELGDRVLSLARAQRIHGALMDELLDRLMRCYIEPRQSARMIAQIEREIRKHEQS